MAKRRKASNAEVKKCVQFYFGSYDRRSLTDGEKGILDKAEQMAKDLMEDALTINQETVDKVKKMLKEFIRRIE